MTSARHLKLSGDPETDSEALNQAIRDVQEQRAAALINVGVDVNFELTDAFGALYTPLAIAVERRRIVFVELLLAAGANPNPVSSISIAPLSLSCALGRLDMAEVLLKAGADPNFQNTGLDNDIKQGGAIFDAVHSGKSDLIELLIKWGAEVDLLDHNNKLTPFVNAAYDGQTNLMRLLARHGANVSHRYGLADQTILYYLRRSTFGRSKEAREKTIAVLLELGASEAPF